MRCELLLLLPLISSSGLSKPVTRSVDNEGNTKKMLDAMVQLLTGQDSGFDPEFYGELVSCMNQYDVNLLASQDAAWGGMIAYSDSNGTEEDRWGGCLDTGHCHKYHEQNATTQTFHSMTIYEPCNYASNLAYYHVVTQICQHTGKWNMPEDHVRALIQGFATLTQGSAFWHGSHTYLGNVADNRFIDVVAFIAHQASVRNLAGLSSVVMDLSLTPRTKSSVETTDELMQRFIDTPVEQWTQLILDLDMPDYYLTFSGLVSTFLTLMLDDTLADLAIPGLMDLFSLPEEQREFVFNHYLPEIRNATRNLQLSSDQVKELEGNVASTLIKLLYAFLWQEYVITDSAFLLNPVTNVVGSTLIKYVNNYANTLNNFPIYDPALQNASSTIYPGADRCNPQEPHSKWHLESANGLMDLIYLSDHINALTLTAARVEDDQPAKKPGLATLTFLIDELSSYLAIMTDKKKDAQLFNQLAAQLMKNK